MDPILSNSLSDHKPILLKACDCFSNNHDPFKFGNKWIHIEGFLNLIVAEWTVNTRTNDVTFLGT